MVLIGLLEFVVLDELMVGFDLVLWVELWEFF